MVLGLRASCFYPPPEGIIRNGYALPYTHTLTHLGAGTIAADETWVERKRWEEVVVVVVRREQLGRGPRRRRRGALRPWSRPSARAARARGRPSSRARSAAPRARRVSVRGCGRMRLRPRQSRTLSDTLSPRRQRASPGMASGPKWPWPGTRLRNDLVKGSYWRWGPAQQRAGGEHRRSKEGV